MLTRLLLSDDELSALSSLELLALEYVVHERLAEAARRRRSGDSALLFAIRGARYLEPLVAKLGAAGADRLVSDLRDTERARVALARAAEFAELATDRAA